MLYSHPLTRGPSITVIFLFSPQDSEWAPHKQHPASDLRFNSDCLSLTSPSAWLAVVPLQRQRWHVLSPTCLSRCTSRTLDATCMSLLCQVFVIVLMPLLLPLVLQVHKFSAPLYPPLPSCSWIYGAPWWAMSACRGVWIYTSLLMLT